VEESMSETRLNTHRVGRRGGLAIALAVFVLSAAFAWPAMAVGPVEEEDRFSSSLDTTITLGAALRVEERESKLVYIGNGGGSLDPFYANADDGNLNYDKWDVYSTNIKATSELELNYRVDRGIVRDVGAFVRASAFYDVIQNCSSCTRRTNLDSDARHRRSVVDGGVVGTDFQFLDAYLDSSYDIADHFVNLRFGNQVLSWGESLFIPGGINTINAFDVAKIRLPGSELKEALVPAPMIRLAGDIFSTSWGSLGVEAYYQFHWNRTNVDPVGSYWGTRDTTGRGAEGLFFGGSPFALGPVGDPGSDSVIPAFGPYPGCGEGALPFPSCSAQALFAAVAGIPRFGDDEPSNQGQGGVALRFYADPILTEFGLYYIRYHSKTPVVGMNGTLVGPATFFPSDYFRQYADNVDLIGFSFATNVLMATVAGEVSYRFNDPVVLDPNAAGAAASAPFGQSFRVNGFQREEKIQANLSLIQTLGPSTRWGIGPLVSFLRADDISLTSEVAVVEYPSLDGDIPYSAPGGTSLGKDVDEFSWGYQMLMRITYTNPLGIPITLIPSVGWKHDVGGDTPGQTPFVEETKALTVGLDLDYLQQWGFNVTYGRFMGAGMANLVRDRDFLSFSATYRFSVLNY
jgi:hypothetical protein